MGPGFLRLLRIHYRSHFDMVRYQRLVLKVKWLRANPRYKYGIFTMRGAEGATSLSSLAVMSTAAAS